MHKQVQALDDEKERQQTGRRNWSDLSRDYFLCSSVACFDSGQGNRISRLLFI